MSVLVFSFDFVKKNKNKNDSKMITWDIYIYFKSPLLGQFFTVLPLLETVQETFFCITHTRQTKHLICPFATNRHFSSLWQSSIYSIIFCRDLLYSWVKLVEFTSSSRGGSEFWWTFINKTFTHCDLTTGWLTSDNINTIISVGKMMQMILNCIL